MTAEHGERDVLGSVLLVAVILSSAVQALFLRDLEGGISGLSHAARTLNFTTMTAVFLFSWVLLLRRSQTMAQPLSRLVVGLCALTALYIAARTLAQGHLAPALFGLGWLFNIAFFVALLRFARMGGLDRVPVWNWLGVAAMAHLALFLFTAVVYWAEPETRWFHLASGFTNIRHLGYLAAPAAAVAAMLHMTRDGGKVWPLVAFTCAMFYILLTGSRGGLVATSVGTVLAIGMLAATQRYVSWRRAFTVCLMTLGLFVVVTLFPPLPFDTIAARAEQLTAPEDVSRGRLDVWRISVALIGERWGFGFGPMTFSTLPGVPERYTLNHPHNVVLQVLLQWGAVGLALIVAAGVTAMRPVLSMTKAELAHRIPAIAVILTMLSHAIVDGSLFYPAPVAIFLIACAQLVQKPPDMVP